MHPHNVVELFSHKLDELSKYNLNFHQIERVCISAMIIILKTLVSISASPYILHKSKIIIVNISL